MDAPIFPKYDSLIGRALLPLVLGEQITHRDFQNKTASYRLSSPIDVLRNELHWPNIGCLAGRANQRQNGQTRKIQTLLYQARRFESLTRPVRRTAG